MAKLFVVPNETEVPRESIEEIETIDTRLELTGDRAADLEAALRAFAFILAWTEATGGSSGVLGAASTVRAFRQERRR